MTHSLLIASLLLAPDPQRAILKGSHPPFAAAERTLAALPPASRLEGISLLVGRSPEQEAALRSLIAAQHDRTSPLYHQWLTPEQFAARFGASDSDLEAAKAWLASRGFSVDRVSPPAIASASPAR